MRGRSGGMTTIERAQDSGLINTAFRSLVGSAAYSPDWVTFLTDLVLCYLQVRTFSLLRTRSSEAIAQAIEKIQIFILAYPP